MGQASTSPNVRVRPLTVADIKPQPRISVSSLPLVLRFSSKLAESIGLALAAVGAGPWRVTLERIDEGLFAGGTEAGSWFRVESRIGSMTLNAALDRAAISALCEAASGGTGTEPPYEMPDRPISRIEQGIVGLAIKAMIARTSATMADVLDIQVSQFEGVVDGFGDKPEDAIAFRYLLNIFGYSGGLTLTAIAPEIAAQFALEDPPSSKPVEQGEADFGMQRRIARAEIEFMVTLGPETLSVEEMGALAPGQLLRLSSSVASPVIVASEGKPVFTAVLARSGASMAVRIIEPVE